MRQEKTDEIESNKKTVMYLPNPSTTSKMEHKVIFFNQRTAYLNSEFYFN